jgi:hypothetical protein
MGCQQYVVSTAASTPTTADTSAEAGTLAK